jgi:hypothetical protein
MKFDFTAENAEKTELGESCLEKLYLTFPLHPLR